MSRCIESIVQAIQFIEANLKNDINVQDVAGRACYSVYHFIRLFEGVTGHTPKDYILRRRIAEAFSLLTQTNRKVIDICFEYQFKSPEVFSRAFKRIVGATPRDLRKHGHLPKLTLLEPIDASAIRHGENLLETRVDEVVLPDLNLVGMVTLIREEKQIISQVWQWVWREMQRLDQTEREVVYGHSFWSNHYDIEGFFLMCGFETNALPISDAPFCTREVPAGRYLRFVHKGNVESIRLTYKYIFQTYLPKTEHTLSRPFDFEVYHLGAGSPHRDDATTEILIPID